LEKKSKANDRKQESDTESTYHLVPFLWKPVVFRSLYRLAILLRDQCHEPNPEPQGEGSGLSLSPGSAEIACQADPRR
jgi:hypothetical protein